MAELHLDIYINIVCKNQSYLFLVFHVLLSSSASSTASSITMIGSPGHTAMFGMWRHLFQVNNLLLKMKPTWCIRKHFVFFQPQLVNLPPRSMCGRYALRYTPPPVCWSARCTTLTCRKCSGGLAMCSSWPSSTARLMWPRCSPCFFSQSSPVWRISLSTSSALDYFSSSVPCSLLLLFIFLGNLNSW